MVVRRLLVEDCGGSNRQGLWESLGGTQCEPYCVQLLVGGGALTEMGEGRLARQGPAHR